MKSNTLLRVAGLLLAATAVWYIPWMMQSLNWVYPLVSVPFALANLLTVTLTLLSAFNNWTVSNPTLAMVPEGQESDHAVVIPLVNEPIRMIRRTVESVLYQNWPLDKLIIVVSDDGGGRRDVADMVSMFSRKFPLTRFMYTIPPKRGDPNRFGNAKDGNLNHTLGELFGQYPHVATVETRDCDDMVADPNFLRYALYELYQDDSVGAVQTIKEAEVSKGDPFNNNEPLFYRFIQWTRSAINATIICGSGVVFRMQALVSINGFSTWNIVEDLTTGMEMCKAGWKILYLPIVGAVGQIAPENVRDMNKQRGTWAIDAMRLFWWKNPLFQQGLSLRQRLSFLELGLFYLHSIAFIVYVLVAAVSLLFGTYPLVTDHATYAIHFWLFAVAVELFLVSLAHGLPFESLWRSRQLWFGMAPVYAKACVLALIGGPNNKPSYKVTPKVKSVGFFWREIKWHLVLLGIAVFAVFDHMVLQRKSLFLTADLGSLYWMTFMVISFVHVVRLSWFGTGERIRSMTIAFPRARRVRVATTVLSFALLALLLLAKVSLAEGQEPPILVGIHTYDSNGIVNFEQLTEHKLTQQLEFYQMCDVQNYSWSKLETDLAAAKEAARTLDATLESWCPQWDNPDFQMHPEQPQPELSLDKIARGDFDSFFTQFFQVVKESGATVIFRFDQEMSTAIGKPDWYPWQGDPEAYKDAYIHVWEIGRNIAPDMKFMWSAMWLAQPQAEAYYPGDSYVDLVGTTIINPGDTFPSYSSIWLNPQDLIGPEYQAAQDKWPNKPLMLTEVGSSEYGGDKSEWVSEFLQSLVNDYPAVVGFIWLETVDLKPTELTESDGSPIYIDWRIESSDMVIAAFRNGIRDPHFR